MEGYIYVLSNPSMPGLLKIGYTTNLKQRIKKLSSRTGVPEPFKLECFCESIDPVDDERIAHQKLKKYRQSKNREFFRLTVNQASSTVKEVCQTKLYFSLQDEIEDRKKNTLVTNNVILKKEYSFSSEKERIYKILDNLPKVNYRKNGENNDDYIIFGWHVNDEDTSPATFLGKQLNKIFGSEDSFYISEWILARIKNFAHVNRCSMASRYPGHEIYSPKKIVRITLTSRTHYTKDRFTEIIHRVLSLEKTFRIERSKNSNPSRLMPGQQHRTQQKKKIIAENPQQKKKIPAKRTQQARRIYKSSAKYPEQGQWDANEVSNSTITKVSTLHNPLPCKRHVVKQLPPKPQVISTIIKQPSIAKKPPNIENKSDDSWTFVLYLFIGLIFIFVIITNASTKSNKSSSITYNKTGRSISTMKKTNSNDTYVNSFNNKETKKQRQPIKRKARTSKTGIDLRHCLELPTNKDIILCFEKNR